MKKNGFTQIEFYKPGMSQDKYLEGMESRSKEIKIEEIKQFETFVVEGAANN